jgi:nicotinamidase/pyrazinamidase
VRGTAGAAFHPDLAVECAFLILRKGIHTRIDSYSAFVEADGRTTTGLSALLKARGVKRVFACGLATDFCVAHSALDARAEGFATFVIEDACRAIDANNSLAQAWAKMNAAEVYRIQSAEILGLP